MQTLMGAEMVYHLNEYSLEKQNEILQKIFLESGLNKKISSEEVQPKKTFQDDSLKVEWEIKNIGTSDPTVTITSVDFWTSKVVLEI